MSTEKSPNRWFQSNKERVGDHANASETVFTTQQETELPRNFEEIYARNLRGEVSLDSEDGSRETCRAYEIVFSQQSPKGVDELTQFRLQALQAGYRESLTPLLIPNVGNHINNYRINLGAAVFFLSKPEILPSDAGEPLQASHGSG